MDLGNNYFSLPFHWSGGVWAITIVALLLIIGSVYSMAIHQLPTMLLWLKYVPMAFILIIVIGVAAYAPIRLKANNDKITLRRLCSSLEIPLSEVTDVTQISKSYIDGSIRTMGSGGFFGYLGRFKNDRLGNYTMYATELNNLVLIRTNNKKYVFSCTKAQDFVDYVNARLKKQ